MIEISPPTAFAFGAPTIIESLNLQPSGFVTASDAFTGTSGMTFLTETSLGSITASGGQCTVANSGAHSDIIVETSSSFSLPQAFVQITIDVTGTETSVFDVCGVGLFKDADNFLIASHDRFNHQIRVQLKITGTNHFLVVNPGTSYPSSFKLGLSLVMNSANVYVDTLGGLGWVSPTGTNVGSIYDFTAAGALTGWKAGFYVVNGGSGTTWKFSGFSGGYFGTVATKDMAVVTNKDGSPYIVGTTATFTVDCVDGNGTDYLGIFTFDLSSYTLTQVGGIFTSRSGLLFNDVGAHIVYDSSAGTYTLLAASWPTQATQLGVVSGTTTTNILSGFHTVPVSFLTLPGLSTGYGTYDPMMAWDGAKWLLAYTITKNLTFSGNQFYTALASSTDLSTWTLIGADSSHLGYEGTKLILDNGAYYVATGGPAVSGNSSRVYDAAMLFQGSLSATFDGSDGGRSPNTNPHPMVFGVGDFEYLVTFDGLKYDATLGTFGKWWVETADRYIMTQPRVWIIT